MTTQITKSPAEEAIEALLGQVAQLQARVSQGSNMLEDNHEFSVMVAARYPSSWLPDIDFDDGVAEIEGGRYVDVRVRGDQLEELTLEDFISSSVTVYNDIEDVVGRDLNFTNLRFYGQVDFADLQGDYLFASFDEAVEVEYDGDNSVFELSGDDDEFIATYDSGDVTVNGHSGNDEIITGAGNDDVRGGHDDDYVFTGDGDDIISGNDGEDYLFSAGGDDTVLGGDGDDIISGNDGDDVLNGQGGDDRVYAGDGNDALMGSGNDTLDGGAGADQFIFNIEEDGKGQINTGYDADVDLVIVNNVGEDATIAMHLGAGDQAVGYTESGHEIDLDAFYAAADGADFMVGATTFTDDAWLKG